MKKKALLKISITLSFIILLYSFGDIEDIGIMSEKPFSELSSFQQYQPCKGEKLYNSYRKNYDLISILVVEFQVSYIIFGFEQDYYLKNGLDCSFEKRYNFKETIENGKYLTFFLRRVASLSSYIIFGFIVWFIKKQINIIRNE